MKLLFICSQNRLRSPTAEAIFSTYPGIEAISAGTNKDADTPVSADMIEWADLILVMENVHRTKLTQKFGSLLRDKRLYVLDIPDRYGYMDAELMRLLKVKVSRIIET
jgi:predicted protein tyrosine phosphatase